MGLYNGGGTLNRVKALLALTLLCRKTKPKGLFYCGTLIGFCCRFALMPALLKGRIIRACVARVNFAVWGLCACCMILFLNNRVGLGGRGCYA